MALPKELDKVKITIPAHVLHRQVADEVVMLDLNQKSYFGLDPVGSRMWSVVADAPSLAEAIVTLAGEYDVAPDALETDLRELIERLLANGTLSTESISG